MRTSIQKKRMQWVAKYLGGKDTRAEVDIDYATQFCKKIIPGFKQSGIMPDSRLKYIAICAADDENKRLRILLDSIYIKYRVYRVADGYEFIMKTTDYNFYRIALTDDIFNDKDFSTDIDIDKMYKEYKSAGLEDGA